MVRLIGSWKLTAVGFALLLAGQWPSTMRVEAGDYAAARRLNEPDGVPVYRGRGYGQSPNPFSTPYQAMWNEHRAAAEWNAYWYKQNIRNYYASLQRQADQQAAARRLPSGPRAEDSAAMAEEPTKLVPIQNAKDLKITETASAQQKLSSLPSGAPEKVESNDSTQQFVHDSSKEHASAEHSPASCPHCSGHSSKAGKCSHCGRSSSFGGHKHGFSFHPKSFLPKKGLKSSAHCNSCGSGSCDGNACGAGSSSSTVSSSGACSTGACSSGHCSSGPVIVGSSVSEPCSTCNSGPIFSSSSAIIVPEGTEIIVAPNEAGVEILPSLPNGPVIPSAPAAPTTPIAPTNPTAPASAPAAPMTPGDGPTIIIPQANSSSHYSNTIVLSSTPIIEETVVIESSSSSQPAKRSVMGEKLAEAANRSKAPAVASSSMIPIATDAGPVINSPPVASGAVIEKKAVKSPASTSTASVKAPASTAKKTAAPAAPILKRTKPYAAAITKPEITPRTAEHAKSVSTSKNVDLTPNVDAVKNEEQAKAPSTAKSKSTPTSSLKTASTKSPMPKIASRNPTTKSLAPGVFSNRSSAAFQTTPKKAVNIGPKPLENSAPTNPVIFPAAGPEKVDARVGNADYNRPVEEGAQTKGLRKAAAPPASQKDGVRTTLRRITTKPKIVDNNEQPSSNP